jgi:hypothetical protein
MVSINRSSRVLLPIYAGFTLGACGGGGGGPGPSTIGGSISGLVGTVVLELNGSDQLTLSANGSFKFATPVPAGQPYAVTVLTQPLGPDCAVSQGTGTATGGVVTVSVTCVANAAAFYLPLAAQPPPGTSTGTTGLFVISSKEPGVAPVSIFTGATKPIGVSFRYVLDEAASASQGQPTAIAFSSLGAASGDHLYSVDLTADSSLIPVQIGTLTLPNIGSAQYCSVVDAYGDLTDPASAFFLIAIPTDPVYICGDPAEFHWYLVHLADTPSTPPMALPTLSTPIVPIYHADGQLSGFLTVDQATHLIFYSGTTFTNPTTLLSGVSGFGTLKGPLSSLSQVTANPTYSFVAVESTTGSFSLYRMGDDGTLSADLYAFQGGYDSVVSDAANIYVTDIYGTNAPVERIIQVPLSGSEPGTILYEYMPTNNEHYGLLGTAGNSLVLQLTIPNPNNGPISTAFATLPIGTPATPTVIATYANPSSAIIAGVDILVTQTTETGTAINPAFAYSTEIIGPDGTVIQPLQAASSFLYFGTNPLLEVTAVSDPSGLGGGLVSVLNLAEPSSPTLLPLRTQSGAAFTLPVGSEFVANIPVSPLLGWISELGATANTEFAYNVSTNTVTPVSLPNTELSLVLAPTP